MDRVDERLRAVTPARCTERGGRRPRHALPLLAEKIALRWCSSCALTSRCALHSHPTLRRSLARQARPALRRSRRCGAPGSARAYLELVAHAKGVRHAIEGSLHRRGHRVSVLSTVCERRAVAM